jgi:hypothetical protein
MCQLRLSRRHKREADSGAEKAGAAQDSGRPSADRMVDHQEHDSSDNGYDEAVDVQPGHPGHAEQVEQPAADYRSHDAQRDVEEEPFSSFIDQFAANETRD